MQWQVWSVVGTFIVVFCKLIATSSRKQIENLIVRPMQQLQLLLWRCFIYFFHNISVSFFAFYVPVEPVLYLSISLILVFYAPARLSWERVYLFISPNRSSSFIYFCIHTKSIVTLYVGTVIQKCRLSDDKLLLFVNVYTQCRCGPDRNVPSDRLPTFRGNLWRIRQRI